MTIEDAITSARQDIQDRLDTSEELYEAWSDSRKELDKAEARLRVLIGHDDAD